MIKTRATFLHFISDNLANGIKVHPIRVDGDKPGADFYKTNAVNIKFLSVQPNSHIAQTQVELSVQFDNELAGMACVQDLYRILTSATYTPKMDYTIPLAPVPTGTTIYWDEDTIFFKPIGSAGAGHSFNAMFRAVFTLYHKIDL